MKSTSIWERSWIYSLIRANQRTRLLQKRIHNRGWSRRNLWTVGGNFRYSNNIHDESFLCTEIIFSYIHVDIFSHASYIFVQYFPVQYFLPGLAFVLSRDLFQVMTQATWLTRARVAATVTGTINRWLFPFEVGIFCSGRTGTFLQEVFIV